LIGGDLSSDGRAVELQKQILRNRVFDKEGKLNSRVVKFITQTFETLNNKASEISDENKRAISGIDVSDITKIKVEDFIARLEKIINEDSLKFWKFFEKFGYDLWFNSVNFENVFKQHDYAKSIPVKAMEYLISYVQIELCKENKTVLNYPANNLRLINSANICEFPEEKAINYADEALFEITYPAIQDYSVLQIRFTWSLIKTFNKYLSDSIDFINTHAAIPHSLDSMWLNLGTYLSAFRNIWMTPIKIELSNKIMQKSAIARDQVPKVQLERLKFNKEKEKQSTQQLLNPKEIVSYKNRDEFVFTRAYEQLKNVSTTLFRPIKPTGSDPFLAFEVVLKGELVMGEGGPYRQFFADISQELQPNNISLTSQHKNLNLLVPSPNNYSKLGEGRDKYVINPSAKESYQLALFEFLGILMGCSVRTGTHLTLDLPSLFWK